MYETGKAFPVSGNGVGSGTMQSESFQTRITDAWDDLVAKQSERAWTSSIWGTLTGMKKRRAALRRARKLAPVLAQIRAEGATSLCAMAKRLNERGHRGVRGGRWTPQAINRVLHRLDGDKHALIWSQSDCSPLAKTNRTSDSKDF